VLHDLGTELEALAARLEAACAAVAGNLRDGGEGTVPDLTAALQALDARLLAVRAARTGLVYAPQHTMAMLSLTERVKEFAQSVLEVQGQIARLWSTVKRSPASMLATGGGP